jgi:hypothetical protein
MSNFTQIQKSRTKSKYFVVSLNRIFQARTQNPAWSNCHTNIKQNRNTSLDSVPERMIELKEVIGGRHTGRKKPRMKNIVCIVHKRHHPPINRRTCYIFKVEEDIKAYRQDTRVLCPGKSPTLSFLSAKTWQVMVLDFFIPPWPSKKDENQ